MIKRTLVLGTLAPVLAFAVLALSSHDTDVYATHLPGADLIALDADTAGNTATTLGTRDGCVETTAGSTIDIDVTVTNLPAAHPMNGFYFIMTYDPAALSVTVADHAYLLASNAGSLAFTAGDETALPDVDGSFTGTAIDTAIPASAHETGSGVLERLSIEVAGGATAGGYPLYLFDGVSTSSVDSGGKAPDNLLPAQIAVGVTCGSLPAVEIPPGRNGDVDCSNTVNAIDALKVLRANSQLSVAQTEPCTDIGQLTPHIGDVDCGGSVNAIDALKILRFNAGLSVTYTEPCDDINT